VVVVVADVLVVHQAQGIAGNLLGDVAGRDDVGPGRELDDAVAIVVIRVGLASQRPRAGMQGNVRAVWV
jgi:hypothetical protein